MTVSKILPQVAPRSVTILGSTGSVGCNTVDLISRQPDRFRVEALTANGNAELVAKQARALGARVAVVADPDRYGRLKECLAGSGVEAMAGAEAVVEAAARPAEWVMSAIVGAAGLPPTLAAARRGVVVALANKECLVCAGDVLMREIQRHRATLLPVDSEHSAIFQVFDFEQPDKVERIVLTASGGPFRERNRETMAHVTPEEAVAHPNWSMGAKISVDSATMMNKGLEIIEAYHLFPVTKDRIGILVHPQSVVHSMVEYVDGSVLAQLGTPDMRTPIAFALGWPRRMAAPTPRLRLEDVGTLTFEAPDLERFPALRLSQEALRTGGAAPNILNAANEVAVCGFLQRRIGFLDIPKIVEKVLETAPNGNLETVDDVNEADRAARAIAEELVARIGA